MSDFKHIRAESGEQILTLTIQRPEVLNALNREAHRELAQAFDAFAADPGLRVAIITGAGERGFCTGSDLKAKSQRAYDPDESPASGFAGLAKRFDLNKPVIAAVNGYALGGGLEIVLACDLVVAAEHASFGFPEPLVGQAALSGGVQRLVRQIPFRQAMQMLLTCERISAARALEVGLINEVVPKEALMARARALAAQIVRAAPLAIEATKAVALATMSGSLERCIVDHHQASLRMLLSEDGAEGPKAFAEKRAPVWRGR